MSNNRHLKKHHDTWVYSRRVPKALQHLYAGRTHITKSLGTSSVKQARIARDRINGELANQANGSYSQDRIKFKKYVDDVSPWAEGLRDPNMAFDYDDFLPRNPIAKAAYFQEVHGETNHDYTITLKECLLNLLSHNTSHSDDTKSKLKSTVDRFLLFLREPDISLKLIHKKKVVEFIEHLGQDYSQSTISSHLSRLRSVWDHAYKMGDILQKTSPFADHDLSPYKGKPTEQKQLFSKSELQKIILECPHHLKDAALLSLFTSGRLSEVCTGDTELIDGIKCLVIKSGKTASARRVIPIASQIAHLTLPLHQDPKFIGREFSRFKTKAITSDSSRTFHSLRNHFISAAQRAGLPEFETAYLAGHKTGQTMSYGYYARQDIKKLAEAIEIIANQIEKEWLS